MNQAEWAISKVVRRLSFSRRHFPAGTRCRAVLLAAFFVGLAVGTGVAWGITDSEPPHAPGLMGLLGRLHPLAVHFPIALAFAAVFAELLCIWKRNPSFGFAARFLLFVAAVCAVVSVLLGWAAAVGRPPDEASVATHATLGIVTTGLVLLAAALARAKSSRQDPTLITLYRVILLITSIAVALAAHTGATLTFGRGYFSIF